MWQTFQNNDQLYMIKITQENEELKICLTNFVYLWIQNITKESILEQFQRDNPLFDIKLEDAVSQVVDLVNDITNIETEVVVEAGDVKMNLKAEKSGFTVEFPFNLEIAAQEIFLHEITVPLIQTVKHLEEQQKMLSNMLQKKDRELEEYKLEKGEISRGDLITQPFDENTLSKIDNQSMINVFGRSESFWTSFVHQHGNIITAKIEDCDENVLVPASMDWEDSEIDIEYTPLVTTGETTSKAASEDVLSERSKKYYEDVYNTFMEWQLKNNTNSYSEDTLLEYFQELLKKYKSTTLLTVYSILKSTLKTKHNVNIELYARLRALLKTTSEGYQPKKSAVFTRKEINKFIKEAPDYKYLATKVALIMGVMGACRSGELHAVKIEDLIFLDGCVQVLVTQSDTTKVSRYFTVTGSFYDVVKKYIDLRPPDTPSNSFFLTFRRGKCLKHVIGINKFKEMGKEVARFLRLPNPERYTGCCLRKSSGNIAATRQDLGWENDEKDTEVEEAAKTQSGDVLPERSKRNYESVYNTFMDWQLQNNTTSFSEETLLVYFQELTKKYKSTSLWRTYSMIKSTLKMKHDVNIEPYARLRALLKATSEGYQPKTSEVFTVEQVNKFINEAPDYHYLATKVALIMGVTGACRSIELHAMKTEDLKFFENCIQILVPSTNKTKALRFFTLTGSFYHVAKKYSELRPPDTPSNSFFLTFNQGRCTKGAIGINKFKAMSKEIAEFLKLPNPERYTGNSMRKSSATAKS